MQDRRAATSAVESSSRVKVAGATAAVGAPVGSNAQPELLRPHTLLSVSASAAAAPDPRSSQLFETSVQLPFTAEQQRILAALDSFRRWYLAYHALYVCALSLLGALWFYLFADRDLSFVDALFTAVSSVCDCGLTTVSVAEFGPWTTAVHTLLVVAGGIVFTSALQPLMRLLVLRRVMPFFFESPSDTPAARELRDAKRREAAHLRDCSVVCVAASYAYMLLVIGGAAAVLLVSGHPREPLRRVLPMPVAAFHGAVFMTMEPYDRDAIVVGTVACCCALGFTLYPVGLRCLLRLALLAAAPCEKLHAWAGAAWRRGLLLRRAVAAAEDPQDDGGATPLLLRRPESPTWDEDDEGDNAGGRGTAADTPLPVSKWRRCLSAVLDSDSPGTFHPFLFTPRETAYLAGAWVCLTALQLAPFLIQHWASLLRGYSPAYRVYLALCQAASVRFAAAVFVPIQHYSSLHVVVTVLAMYLPPLPIATDRAHRKWRAAFVVRNAVVRLLTSRLFWLLSAIGAILVADEAPLARAVADSRFDVLTRTFFEVVSAYACCGLSLAPASAGALSLAACLGTFSKAVLMAVMLAGRHRFVDLGTDLGFGLH